MDAGIGRLVEMFEERFGRFATNIVIAILVLSAVVLALHIITSYLVIPIITVFFSIIKFLGNPNKHKIFNLLIGMLPLISFIFIILWAYIFGSRFMKNLRARANLINDTAIHLDKWKKIINDNLEKSQNLIDESKKYREKQEEILQNIRDLYEDAKNQKDKDNNSNYTI